MMATLDKTTTSSALSSPSSSSGNNNNNHNNRKNGNFGKDDSSQLFCRGGVVMGKLLPILFLLVCFNFISDTQNLKRVDDTTNTFKMLFETSSSSSSSASLSNTSSSPSSLSALPPKKIQKTRRRSNQTELILWIPVAEAAEAGVTTSNFDTNFTVSEKGMERFLQLSKVIKFEIRHCIRTTTPTTHNSTAMLPSCPTPPPGDGADNNNNNNINNNNNNLGGAISRNDVNLIICYDATNPIRQPLLKKSQIVAVTTTTTTTAVDYKSKKRIIMTIVHHNDILIQRGVCAKECDNFWKDESAPYLYDTIDHLCKSSDIAAVPPKRKYGGSCACETTCYTPEAVDLKSPYPWKSHEEYKLYHDGNLTTAETGAARRRSQMTRASQRYEMRFLCQQNKTENQKQQQQSEQQPSSSIVNMPGEVKAGFEHHFFFFPEGKLIFCGIPKAGITEWIKFLRFYMGANDYLSIPHWKADISSFMMSSLTLEKATELLADPTWTKAMFIRDPAERLLSAYSNKVASQSYTQSFFNIHNGTRGTFRTNKDKKQEYILSFDEFVDLIAHDNQNNPGDTRGLHGKTDPHWRPQSVLCGMDYLLPHLDFIGSFEHIGEHTKMLLEKVGLWEKYGSKFDPAEDVKLSGTICNKPAPHRASNYTPIGFNQRGPTSTTGHITDSKSKLDKYYTPEMLQKVRRAYAHDYEIWDDLKGRAADDVLSGSDLKIVKNHCGGSSGDDDEA